MGNSIYSEGEKSGFQITTVSALSPGAECGLKASEDFIIKLNGVDAASMDLDHIMNIVRVSH